MYSVHFMLVLCVSLALYGLFCQVIQIVQMKQRKL